MANLDELLRDHVQLEVECLDRIYLNGYVPTLQTSGALVTFLRQHRKHAIPSPALLDQMTKTFRKALDSYCTLHEIPMIHFERNERKDDVAKKYLARHDGSERVLFVGVAQEKAWAFKCTTLKSGGKVSFEYSRQWVYVNHYYFYLYDAEFGPAFIKLCAYMPYPMKVYINGHEWVKQQLRKEQIVFDALDNGVLSCQNPPRLKELCAGLGAEQIEHFFAKWMDRLPLPLVADDRAAGYRHRLSINQLEVSLTQVVSSPSVGRTFFEEVIRENLDVGRPDRVQLVFDRKLIGSTPGTFRTSVVTRGVMPSIQFHYKSCRVKQYFKLNRALRTETTINNARDFYVKKDISQLDCLRTIGQTINRNLLQVLRLSHSCRLSASSFQRVVHPSRTDAGQRVPGLRFGDGRVTALLQALILIMHRPPGFLHKELRPYVAELLGPDCPYTTHKMSYDLRRLRHKGIIYRLPNTNRYSVTTYGRQVILFLARLERRVFDRVFAAVDGAEPVPSKLALRIEQLNKEFDRVFQQSHFAAAA